MLSSYLVIASEHFRSSVILHEGGHCIKGWPHLDGDNVIPSDADCLYCCIALPQGPGHAAQRGIMKAKCDLPHCACRSDAPPDHCREEGGGG